MGEVYSNPVSGGGIAAGRYASPLWLRNATIGQISTVGTALSTVDPSVSASYNADYPATAAWCKTSGGGVTNYTDASGAFAPWCSAVWDEQTLTYWLPTNGGHGDYGGNESYRQIMSVDSPAFELYFPPSGSVPLIAGGLPAGATPLGNSYLLDDNGESTLVYKDGRLRAMHSYRLYALVPGVGIVMTAQAGQFRNAAIGYKTYLLNPTTREWDYKCERSSGSYGVGNPIDGAAVYDPSRNLVWFVGSGLANFWGLNVTSWTWTRHDSLSKNNDYPNTLEYIGDGLLFYANEQLSNGFRVVDPSDNSLSNPGISNPASGPTIYGNSGVAWASDMNCLIFRSDNSLYKLKPGASKKSDPWTWSQITTTGAFSSVVGSGGDLGKFVYSPRCKCVFLIRNANTPINFVKVA